jgi:hypothetical protein
VGPLSGHRQTGGGARRFGRSRRHGRITVSSLRRAWRAPPPATPRATRRPLRTRCGGRRPGALRRCHDRRMRDERRLRSLRSLRIHCVLDSVTRWRPAAAAASTAPGRRRPRRGLFGLRLCGGRGAHHTGPDLALGAQSPSGGVHIHAPDHDRGGRAPDRRPLLGQGPARIDRVPGVDGPRELPVQPLPFGHGGHRHVHRAKADRHRHQEGRRSNAAVSVRGVDREWGEITGDRGEKRDL